MGVLRVKAGVCFDRIAPAGFRLLGTLDRLTRELPYDLTITSGSDSHSPTDPHTLGQAFDVRSHGLTPGQRDYLVRAVLLDLQEGAADALISTSGGLATRRFFGFLEDPGTANEHFHYQLRRGAVFP